MKYTYLFYNILVRSIKKIQKLPVHSYKHNNNIANHMIKKGKEYKVFV